MVEKTPHPPYLHQSFIHHTHSSLLSPHFHAQSFIIFHQFPPPTFLREVLEEHYHLKLCIPERDLLPGLFKQESIARLIKERLLLLLLLLLLLFLLIMLLLSMLLLPMLLLSMLLLPMLLLPMLLLPMLLLPMLLLPMLLLPMLLLPMLLLLMWPFLNLLLLMLLS